MKSIRLILSAAIFWGLLPSCSNEIDLYPDDVPEMLYVVGCIDVSGPLQQVKLRKMITGNLDAFEMINNPAYYLPDRSTRVIVENSFGTSVRLYPVLYPAQTGGPFAQDSNLIYQAMDLHIAPGETYSLMIDDTISGETFTSTITTVNQAVFYFPTKESVVHGRFRFVDSQRPFRIQYAAAPSTFWTLSIKYVDFMPDGEMYCRKANYNGPRHYGQATTIQEFPLDYLWRIFNLSIPDDPNVEARAFYRFDFSVWNADSALTEYMGVAGRFTDNRKQYFNNINGGMGLFFSVSHAQIKNVYPLESFHVALSQADTLRHLKFSRYPYEGLYTDPDSSMVNPFFN